MLLRKKKHMALLLCLMAVPVLFGCAKKVEFSAATVRDDVTELSIVLQSGETALLDALPELDRVDLSGSGDYAEIAAWAEAHPDVAVSYTVEFPEGTVAANDCTQLDLSALAPEDVEKAAELMAYLPKLEKLTLLPGLFTPTQVETLLGAVEGLEGEYSYSLGSITLDWQAEKADLSALRPEDMDAALELLPQLPRLKSVELGRDTETALSWEHIYALVSGCPDMDFDFDFSIYGKSFRLSDKKMDLDHIQLGDNGAAAYMAARCMRQLEYLDMDFCGVPNEVMEQIRAGLPGVKVVWRIWFGRNYSVRTDVEKILASNPSNGGTIWDEDAQQLKYCTELKYLDLGHNEVITDISFVSYMPKLEVAVLAMNNITDLSPLANCPELEYLEIQTNNGLSDLSPLANCTKLRHLNTAHCRLISDISPLYGCTELERFWLGASNGVPAEQVEEFKRRVPDCEVNVHVFSDPTTAGWRMTDLDIITWQPTYAPRYELLMEQFGYLEHDYSFTWKDPKYEVGVEE